jgi:hypothetical protein
MIDDLANATITSIAPPPTVNSSGGRTEQPPVIVSLRCFADEPRRAQMLSLANVVADASMVVYVPVEHASSLIPQARVTVAIDSLIGSQTMQVLHRVERIKVGGLSHAEVFLKAVTL